MAFVEADFKLAYPEFTALSSARYTALAAQAQRAVSADTWGFERDDIVMLTIASMLSQSPGGRVARLEDAGTPSNVYEKQLKRRIVAHAWANRATYTGDV